MNNIINNIGTKIKYYRNLNKISLSKLAKDANISKSTLFGLEEGKSNPTISTLINLSKSLNIKLSELIDDNLESENSSKNLSLLHFDKKSSKYIYKLILLSNEFIDLNFPLYSKVEIELIDGDLIDVKSNTIISRDKKVAISPDSRLKSLNNGASALIYLKAYKDIIYTKDDIFFNKPSKDILNSLVQIAQNTTIIRAIFSSIYPVEFPNKKEYIQIVELNQEKEVHYYIYSILKGVAKQIETIYKDLKIDSISLENKLNYIKKINHSEHISKDDFIKCKEHPVTTIYKDLENLFNKKYKNLKVLSNQNELKESLKDSYILLIEDLITEANSYYELKNKTLKIKLYRLLELLAPLKEYELNEEELKVYLHLKNHLPKAFYFAKNSLYNLAIDTIKKMLNSIEIESIDDSKISIFYKEIYKKADKLLKEIDSFNCLNTKESLEQKIQDLNYKVVLKENIHPSINGNGKFLYLLELVK